MTEPDLIALFVEPMEGLEVPYMITGGVAVVIYGEPRFTRDIALELQSASIGRLVSAFPAGEFYVPPIELLEQETARPGGGHFNVIHHETALRADIYLASGDPLQTWAFGRRLRLPIDRMAIWVAPIEYVILRKLEYFRMSGSDRHLRDAVMMLRISGDSMDAEAFGQWVRRLDLQEPLAAAIRFGGE